MEADVTRFASTKLAGIPTLLDLEATFTPLVPPQDDLEPASITFSGTNVYAKSIVSHPADKPFDHFYAIWVRPGTFRLEGSTRESVPRATSVAGKPLSASSVVSMGYPVPAQGEIEINALFGDDPATRWTAVVQYDLNFSNSVYTTDVRHILFPRVGATNPGLDGREYAVMLGLHTPKQTVHSNVPNFAYLAIGVLR